jgi:formate dehydrogenase major subunit
LLLESPRAHVQARRWYRPRGGAPAMSWRDWPLLRQIREGGDGSGREAMSARTRGLLPKTADCAVTRSVCPYCAVGCGQLVYHRDGELVAIEGDPESPISRGRLCPKGAASHQLLTHDGRVTRVKYRPPFATAWQELSLDEAMKRIAERVWASRERSFVDQRDGARLMQCQGMAHLGGATLDNEENYLIKKLFTGGLGMTRLSNQARI